MAVRRRFLLASIVALPAVAATGACQRADQSVASAAPSPVAAAPIASAPAAVEPATLVVQNAQLWTGLRDQPLHQALAARGEQIVFVGSNADVAAYVGPDSRVIDAAGRFVMPGFSDNHVHFAEAAQFLEFSLLKTSSQDEFVAAVRDVVASLAPGEWIVGGNWGAYDAWTDASAGGQRREPFTPDISRVAELTRQHPVFIQRFDGAEFAVNEAALVAAGLDPKRPRAKGVKFERRGGKLTGIVRGDAAQALFESKIPKPFSLARRTAQTKKALDEVRRHGVTNFSDMSDDLQLEIYRQLHAKGELTSRVHFRYHLERYDELAKSGVAVGSGDAWIRLGALKGHIDGIMGSSSARFFAPYEGQGDNRGRWRRLMVDEAGELAPGKFVGYMLGADRANLQMSVHAIGDEAHQVLLDYLDQLNREVGVKDRRFRLVHAQVIAPAEMARLGEHKLVAEVQPFHLSDDMRWMEERIGKERCAGAYAFRTIQDSGATLSFGTDWPGTAASLYPINPMYALYAAATRQTLGGEPAAGWFPQERISVEDGLVAYTYGSSYANFEEHLKGTLEVGKLADITMLSENPLAVEPKQLLGIAAEMTIVGGMVVFDAGAS